MGMHTEKAIYHRWGFRQWTWNFLSSDCCLLCFLACVYRFFIWGNWLEAFPALPWILHEIFTLMTLVGLFVGMYFIARSYRLSAKNTQYLVRQLDAARGAFQEGLDSYFEQWRLAKWKGDCPVYNKGHDHFRNRNNQRNKAEYNKDAIKRNL